MATVLPPVLEALLRTQGRQYPNASEMEELGMPIGVPFSNQNPGTGYRNVPSGTLQALTTMLSGLAPPTGFEPPPVPEPRTMFIRPVLSPTMAAGGEAAYQHVGGMAAPGDERAMLGNLISRGGTTLDQGTVQGYQARAAQTGQGMGIADPARYKQVLADRQTSENARRERVNQRAMQVAQARTNRLSGMDPRLAAILAAVGADSDLGQIALGDAIGGRGAGLAMREQNIGAETDRRALDIKAKENSAGGTAQKIEKPAGEDAARAIAGGRLEDINKTNPPATNQEAAVRAEAAKIYDRHIKSGLDPRRAMSVTARELIDSHGVAEAEAIRIASLFSDEKPLPRKPMTKAEAGRKDPLSGEKTFEEDPVGWITRWALENTPLPNFLGEP